MAGLCNSGSFLTRQAAIQVKCAYSLPAVTLFLGLLVDYVVSKADVEGLPNQ